MSFIYKNNIITLDNYKIVFKDYSLDMLDEIRSAVLDGTQIGKYIDLCGNDYEKLSQLRKAEREDIYREYINPSFTSNILKRIRQGVRENKDMSELLRYVNYKGVFIDMSSIEIITDFLILGADLSKLDFKQIPTAQVKTYCSGMLLGYPMWLLQGKTNNISDEKLNILVKGMNLGVDISVFCESNWSIDVIKLLLLHAKKTNINALLSKITPKFTKSDVICFLRLLEKGVNIDLICKHETDGTPIYNEYQIDVLSKALELGLYTEEMFDPSLSDIHMYNMLKRQEALKNGGLKINLTERCSKHE